MHSEANGQAVFNEGRRPRVDILMYHSISDGTGPTCIPRGVFRDQLAALADSGWSVTPMKSFIDTTVNGTEMPERSVVLTFDDGFEDFSTAAWPELEKYGWKATIYIPCGKVGGSDDWEARKAGTPGRPLMTWPTIAALARAGVDVASHAMTHSDLTALPDSAMRTEVSRSKEIIEQQTGCPVTSIAPPYGKTNAAVKQAVREYYSAAVGTRMGHADSKDDLYDLPRIEMWYFRNPKRWRQYLVRGTSGYFRFRQLARGIRALVF